MTKSEQVGESKDSQRKAILLALHMTYFDRMEEGTKRYEYRSRFPKEPVRAFVYAPREVQKVVGYIDLAVPIVGSREQIAELHAACDEGDYDAMISWMGERERFCAMRVENVVRFSDPISYEEIKERFPGFRAPQSYIMLENKPELFEYLEERRNNDNDE